VVPNTKPEQDPGQVSRRWFELCAITEVMHELKSGDLCIPGSDRYSDFREQFVSEVEFRQNIESYGDRSGIPTSRKLSSPRCKATWRKRPAKQMKASAMSSASSSNTITSSQISLIFHNVVTMSKALERLIAEGYAVDADLIACSSPYLTGHLNRFGRYDLNRDRVPEPLDSVREFRMPPRGERNSRSAEAAV
jgi:hypothetical protein